MTWWHFFLIGGAAGSSVQVAIDWWYTLITLRHPAILGFELNGALSIGIVPRTRWS